MSIESRLAWGSGLKFHLAKGLEVSGSIDPKADNVEGGGTRESEFLFCQNNWCKTMSRQQMETAV